MFQPRATCNKDHEDIVQEYMRIVKDAGELLKELDSSKGGIGADGMRRWFSIRTSALNLISRTAGESSIYYRALLEAHAPNTMHGQMPSLSVGIIEAAMTDYREGFMADAKLHVSAEVLTDFLVQAEVLLEHDYKDAAAVLIRAVLEDGLRRVCLSKGIEVKDRAGVDDLTQALTKQNVLTALQKKEIDAKRELANAAVHGRFSEYTKQDVVAFHEFVQRLLATLI